MVDREKVIEHIADCVKIADYQTNHNWVFVRTEILRNALALLKAQVPRVMTLEEVNALDWDYCYLEQERLPGKEYRGMLGKYIMTCVTWPSITAAKISYGAENYGRTWRCWTSRPTEEQREKVKWE